MLMTDRLKLASDENSTVHGKEFHTVTILSTKKFLRISVITSGHSL